MNVRMQGMIKLHKKHDIDEFYNLVMHRQLAMAVISRNIEGNNKHFDLLFDTHCQTISLFIECRGPRGRDRMVVALQLSMQSVPITTDVESSNFDQGEVYNTM
jgi:hypothetical protein